jgi:GNAT superfamily N-acetyltransferase
MSIRLERPGNREQLATWAEILKRVSDLSLSLDELEHAQGSRPHALWLLAYRDGEAAGLVFGGPGGFTETLYCMIRVLPEHRRRGVGTALYAAGSEHARTHERDGLFGRIRADDADSLGFAEKRGFREVGREREVVLDVAGAPPVAAEPPTGIEIVSLAERPDLAQRAHEVEVDVAPDLDLPGLEGHEPWSLERWRSENLEGPGALPDACLVALADGDVVGYTGLRSRGVDAVAENLMTAVRKPWRERGIATALKRAQIERARALGIERISTTNEEQNAPMRGINARLGYEPMPVQILMRGPLAKAPT